MAKVVLTNQLAVSINGADLSSHVAAFTVTAESAEVETSSFGNSWTTRVGGLKSGSVAISFHADFAASSVNPTLGALLGSYATVVASGTLGGTTVAGTALCLVTSITPIGGALGDLMVQDVQWPTSGTVTGWGL